MVAMPIPGMGPAKAAIIGMGMGAGGEDGAAPGDQGVPMGKQRRGGGAVALDP